MSRLLVLLGAAALLAVAGCATTSGESPETRIAEALQQYRHQSEEFADRRRQLVRARVALSLEAQADTAHTRAELSRTLAAWRIGGDKDRLDLYDRVLAASREADAALEAQDKLADEQRAALDKADARVEVRGDQLSAAAKSLLALGDERKLASMARRYLEYLMKTRDEWKKLDAPVVAGDRPPPK